MRVDLPRFEAGTLARLPGLMGRLGVAATGVVQVGAHRGEEMPVFQRCGFDLVVLVEPQPLLAAALRATYGLVAAVEPVACSPASGMATLYLDPASANSSLSRRSQTQLGEVMVRTLPLRELQAGCNVAVVDVNGSELEVLASADLDALDLLVVDGRPGAGLLAFMGRDGWSPAEEWVHGGGASDVVFHRSK